MAISIYNLYPNDTVNPENPITFTWDISGGVQGWYRLTYRKIGDDIWEFDSGKIQSTNQFCEFQQNTFEKNMNYEWRIMVWCGTEGSEDQSSWFSESFLQEFPQQKLIYLSGTGQRVRLVDTGHSKLFSNFKLYTPPNTLEFDLVEPDDWSASRLRIRNTTTKTNQVQKQLEDLYFDHSNSHQR